MLHVLVVFWRLSLLWCLQYSQKEDKYEEEIKVLTDKLKEVWTSFMIFSPPSVQGEASISNIISLYEYIYHCYCVYNTQYLITLDFLLPSSGHWNTLQMTIAAVSMIYFCCRPRPVPSSPRGQSPSWEDHWWPWRYDFLSFESFQISSPCQIFIHTCDCEVFRATTPFASGHKAFRLLFLYHDCSSNLLPYWPSFSFFIASVAQLRITSFGETSHCADPHTQTSHCFVRWHPCYWGPITRCI